MSDLDAAWARLKADLRTDGDLRYLDDAVRKHGPSIEAAARAASTPEADEAWEALRNAIASKALDATLRTDEVSAATIIARHRPLIEVALQGTQVEGGAGLDYRVIVMDIKAAVKALDVLSPADRRLVVAAIEDVESRRAALSSPLPEDPTP